MLRQPHRIVECTYKNVGRARALGAQHALEHFGDRPLDRLWLASTDADSLVDPYWLVDHLAVADGGVDGLAGTVRVDDWRGYTSTQVDAFQRFYDAPSSTHVHGTNLGVRASAYVEVGGFGPLSSSEAPRPGEAAAARAAEVSQLRLLEMPGKSNRCSCAHSIAVW